MINSGKLAGRTIFITGASRGIGKSIALKAAQDGANIVIASKTAEPHPKLPGTIYSTAEDVEAAGGKALPCEVDIRDEQQVIKAVENAVQKFGGIDILVNNASAVQISGTLLTSMKKYDLMQSINTRGAFLVSKICLPYLKKGTNPHILNISPPLNMAPHWFKDYLPYTLAKYGMSMCVLGLAAEFNGDGISVNALWPRTSIHTAATEMLIGKEVGNYSRKPEMVADAAYAIFTNSKPVTGQFLIDEDVLKEAGIKDFTDYAVNPANVDNLLQDAFIDKDGEPDHAKHSKNISDIVSDSGSALEKMFNSLTKNLSPELVESTKAIFQFNVTGSENGIWFVDLKNGRGSIGEGEPSETPDSTFTANYKVFHNMFSGKMKPTVAFASGKLKIGGDLQKALKLEKLMNSIKLKL